MNHWINVLKQANQDVLADYFANAASEVQEKLAAQFEQIDFTELPTLIRDYVLNKPVTAIPADLSPAPFFPYPAKNNEQALLYTKAYKAGEEILSAGKAAALTVAGGQGTRLGFDGPKGTYPITPVLNKTLFQYFAEGILRVSEKYSKPLTWYIMTSEINDAATRSFFAENKYFGLAEDQVFFFTQGFMPAVGYDGNLLRASADSLALSPNGHGGTLLALRKSGALDAMKKAGVEYISYFQVDNPLVPVADPLFIGLHAMEKSQISCRMLPKTNPYEKLGNFCMSEGRCQIIEYSDMPAELAERRKEDGTLDFLAGSPAIHIISRDFVETLTADGKLKLPWHRADKKVPYMDANGVEVKPEEPNAVKLESFIFDALPLAEKVMILEGCREDIFGPTKNKTGVDSAESCRAMLIDRDARRMEAAGIAIPRNAEGKVQCILEISPRCVVDEADAIAFFGKNPVPAPVPGAICFYGK